MVRRPIRRYGSCYIPSSPDPDDEDDGDDVDTDHADISHSHTDKYPNDGEPE